MSFFNMRGIVVEDAPGRPSHFHEDQNERVPDAKQGTVDYATTVADDQVDYGFMPPAESQPVYMTEAPPVVRYIKRWQPATYNVDSADPKGIRIAGNDRNRTRLLVANLDAANSVYLTLDQQNKNPAFARELAAGKEVEMFHNSEVTAFSLVGNPKLTVHAEYEVDPKP